METKGLREFHREVQQDETLRKQIEATTDPAALAALVVRLGRERGYSFSVDEVTKYMREVGAANDVTGYTIFRVNVDRDEATIVRPSREHTCTARVAGRCANPSDY